ncbi:MAG: bifunctional DNA primase/polymerase, partial [Saccharothrix sp.]|nr:bifunctional DNA primase/polymerase [Saccharothrix sp.]
MTTPDPEHRHPRLTRVALRAAARGLPVFPLLPRQKRPAVRDWQHRATTDPAEIVDLWAQRPYNVAIATGPAGLVVLDLDDAAHHGHTDLPDGHPRHGRDTLARAAQEADRPYPSGTYTVRTPGGGTHLNFTA